MKRYEGSRKGFGIGTSDRVCKYESGQASRQIDTAYDWPTPEECGERDRG